MTRITWTVGVLLSLSGGAVHASPSWGVTIEEREVVRAFPAIDCRGEGKLLGTDVGVISLDDQLITIKRTTEVWHLNAVSLEDFCAEHEDLIAFILPVPKMTTPSLDPNQGEPAMDPTVGAPEPGFAQSEGDYSMSPAKPNPVGEDAAQTPEVDEPTPVEDEAPPAPQEAHAEPAPSPSREPQAVPEGFVGGAGCAAAPEGNNFGFFGWALAALLALRRRGGAR